MLQASQWFETPLGQYLLDKEQACFDQLVSNIFGFNAIQLGLPEHDFLQASRMPFKFKANETGSVLVKTALTQMPFDSQSVDLLLLPHVLEFNDYPHQILREVERVLVPDGQVLISGFNPISLWGLRRLISYSKQDYPWRGKFIALARLKDWLALLGFEVMAGKLCCYVPPVKGEHWLTRWQFLEAAGDRWWALGGGVYFLLAKKRVVGMRLITPTWRDKTAAEKSLAAAATQKTVEHEQ